MKIRTQFILSTALFGIILSFIAGSAFINDQRMQQSDKQQEIARSIEQEANELSFLTNDYLLYRESLQLARWESKSAALSSDLSNLKTAIPEQQVLVSSIKSNHQQLQSVFNEVKSSLGQGTSDLPFLQITWSRLKVQSQGMIFDASRLVQLLHEGENQLRQTTSQLIFAMAGIFGAFLLVNYLLTNLRTLKALSTLQAGARIIGSGNLDYAIDARGKDEIGDLSRAFNRMTLNLKDVTASKADLEREVSARKAAEEMALKAAEDWEATFDAIPDFITIHDQNYNILRANQATAAGLGRAAEEISGQHCYSLIHGTDEPWPNCPHQLAMAKKEVVTVEFYEPHLKRHLEVTCSPILETNGEVSGTVHVVRDITERKQAEEALRDSEEKYRNIIETAHEGIRVVSLEGNVTFVNKRMADMLGVKPEELIGRAATDFLDGEDMKARMVMTRKDLAENKRLEIEYRFRRKDGDLIWTVTSASPVYDDAGNHTGNLGMFTDITERKQAEEALKNALAVSNEQWEELSAVAEALRAIIEKATFKDAALSIFNICKRMTGATAGYVALLSQDGKENQVLFLDSGGISCTVDENLPMPIRGLREKAYQTNKAVYENDFQNSEWVKYMPSGHAILNNVLFAPLVIDGKAAGLIGLANKTGGFNEYDLKIATAMGEYASIGLKNSNLLEAITESERRYRQFIETTTEGVWIAGTDGQTSYVNKRMADMLGVTVNEVIGRKRDDFFDPEYLPFAMKVRAERAKGISGQYELKLRRKDGTPLWVLVSGSPVYNKDGTHIGNLGMHKDITDRKQAEEALQKLNDELEERVTERTGELETANFNLKAEIAAWEKAQERIRYLATFPELNPATILEIDSNGEVTYANPAAKHELYDIENVGSLHPYLRNWQMLFEEAQTRDIAFVRDLQVKEKWYEQTVHYLPETKRLRIFGRDITRRKRAEKELRDASLYARSLIEASLDPLVTISREGKIMDVNKATELATGVPRDKLIGTDFSNYFTDPEKAKAGYEEVFSQGSVWDYPLTLRHTSGNTMDVLYNASVYRDEKGEVLGVFAAARDITERKKLEEELRDASLYARSLIEASLDPLVTISRDGKITDANKATELITGVAREKLVETDFFDYFTEPEKAREGYQQVFAMGFVRDFPLTVRHLSGKTTDVLYNAGIYRNEYGEMEGVLATARDITERKKLETELRRSNNELQQFAYITSHDLQEPLRMITSYLQLLERRYKNKLDKDADEFIGYAVDGAARLRNMINDLLEYSRIETRGKPFQPTSSETALEAALDNLKIAIQENKAIVTHEPLPVVTADPAQLIQLFQNLIGNGVKFHGSEPPRVHVSAKKESNEWVFTVKDNGIGIDPQYFDRIFHVFQRLHTRDEYPGTGIGLALAKRIVERHKGRIWVESGDGKGATFYFTIPL